MTNKKTTMSSTHFRSVGGVEVIIMSRSQDVTEKVLARINDAGEKYGDKLVPTARSDAAEVLNE